MAHKRDEELGPKELARRQYMRAYRATHAEHLARLQRAGYVKNKKARLAHSHEYYQEHKQEYIERARQYRLANAEYLRGYWRKRKTGCSADLYAELLKKQRGVCAICGGTDPRELCADHDHGNGSVRGLLCRNCDLGIGHLRHDMTILHAAIRYLKKPIRT